MTCRCLSSFLAPVLAIGGLIVIGGAGYRVIGGDCPMCPQGAAKTVSTTVKTGHCSFTGSDSGAAVQTVGGMSQHDGDGCCPAKGSPECTESKSVGCDEPPCCPHAPADKATCPVKSDKVAASGK